MAPNVFTATDRDPVTGVPGVGVAIRRLRDLTSLPANRTAPLAVATVHIDGFRDYNNMLGAAGADVLLRKIACRITAAHAQRGTVCRLLGPALVAVFDRAVTPEAALIGAEALLHALHEPLEVDGRTIAVSAHAGVVWHDGSAIDADILLRWADSAALTAKRQGRPNAMLFEPDVQLESTRALRLRNELRTAVAARQLRIEFQPVISLERGQTEGAEALVRWDHPELGMVYPLEFLPSAGQAAVAESITELVLDQALEALGRWRRENLVDDDFNLAINVSAAELSGDLDDIVEAALARHGVPGEALTLEITESSLLPHRGRSLEVAHRLRAAGVQLAIDDFGSAYSSLLRLLELPFTGLKIDSSFVEQLATSPVAAAIVGGVTAMAASLELTLIAEGVEDVGQAEVLRQFGVPAAQGFLWSRPLAADRFETWLRSYSAAMSPLPQHISAGSSNLL